MNNSGFACLFKQHFMNQLVSESQLEVSLHRFGMLWIRADMVNQIGFSWWKTHHGLAVQILRPQLCDV